MTRTPTLPFDDRRMWRRLVGRSHPDAGGDDELFIWTVATRDAVCGDELEAAIARVERRAPSTQGTGERVSFDEDASLEVLTDRAIAMAEAVAELYGFLLRQVADCEPAEDEPLRDQQRRGASFKSLAAIGYGVDLTKAERVKWYRIAEAVPLSQRHAGHFLSRIKRRAA
jgi:hypothetical protein